MLTHKKLVAVLAATTFLAAGGAYAADQAAKPTADQAALTKDAGRLSADGVRAYNDVALTRLAIFDGRIAAAKKYVNEADADFAKAKTDESVFMKAEAELRSPAPAKGAEDAAANQTAANDAAGDKVAAKPDAKAGDTKAADATTPKRWLPVDAEMSLNEDFTATPAKAAAIADANKSLAKGDKKGAMEKLKLADVDIDYIMAVVPLDQTLADVHQAATLVNDGKYYEASQMLRQVQDGTRYDLLDISGTPGAGGPHAAKIEAPPATH